MLRRNKSARACLFFERDAARMLGVLENVWDCYFLYLCLFSVRPCFFVELCLYHGEAMLN